jgi:hypothetical protein
MQIQRYVGILGMHARGPAETAKAVNHLIVDGPRTPARDNSRDVSNIHNGGVVLSRQTPICVSANAHRNCTDEEEYII